MIVGYDKNPNLDIDRKLQSLVESMQVALNEITAELNKIKKEIEEIKENEQ